MLATSFQKGKGKQDMRTKKKKGGGVEGEEDRRKKLGNKKQRVRTLSASLREKLLSQWAHGKGLTAR
jgi:hypothetical protein